MELKLLKESDPVLRTPSDLWDFNVDGDPAPLVKAMAKVMFENNGIGLAAPQCGVMKRVLIMGTPELLIVCINPEILGFEGEDKGLEGCLSFPNLWLNVRRPNIVHARYQGVTGEVIQQTLDGIKSRVYQHELDHLNGICFDTKVGPVALDLAKEKRRRKSR